MLDYTLFGESHGPVVGVLLRHVPAGIPVDALQMEQALLRRRSTGGLSPAGRRIRCRSSPAFFRGIPPACPW